MGSSASTTRTTIAVGPHQAMVAPSPSPAILLCLIPSTPHPSTLSETEPCEKLPVPSPAALTPPLLPTSSLTPFSSTSDPPAHLDLSKFKAVSFSKKSATPHSDFLGSPITTPRLQKKQRHEFTSVLSEEERDKSAKIKALRSLLPTGPDLHSCPCVVKDALRRGGASDVGGGSKPYVAFQQQQHRRRSSIVMLPPQSALDGDVNGSVSNTFKQRRRQRLCKRGTIDFVLPSSTRTSIATVNTTATSVNSRSFFLASGGSSDDEDNDSSFVLCGDGDSSGDDGLSFSGVVRGEGGRRMAHSQPLPPI